MVAKAGFLGLDRDYTLAMKSDATVEFLFGNGGSDYVRFRSQSLVTPGEWTHVAATRDGTESCLYLNGQLDSCTPYSFVPTDKGQGLKIGACGAGPWGFFKGKLDDVRIYDQALSNEEIQEISNEQ